MIVDGHATIGANRDVALSTDDLLETMSRLGIEYALVAPPESMIPVHNRAGNELVAAAADRANGRLLPYAVASPWLGDEAVEELRRAHAGGARALKLDPALQGFDLLDGLADPLIGFAVGAGWPIYVRTGTPPHAQPLQLAWLAGRHPGAWFVMGKSGATDFSADGPPALATAPNLLADSAWVDWPTRLAGIEPETFGDRVVFTTDTPFAQPEIELARVMEAGLDELTRAAVLGETLGSLLAL
ncbi:MAG TPA: amidohydrolase family protein [Gaiellaceae bacterium]